MSSDLVLLNESGLIEEKLPLPLSNNYTAPCGMTISLSEEVEVSPRSDLLRRSHPPVEPMEAYFYFRSAVLHLYGQDNLSGPIYHRPRLFKIMVRGTAVRDIMELRSRTMTILYSGYGWKVRNDLNPKSWFERLLHWVFGSK